MSRQEKAQLFIKDKDAAQFKEQMETNEKLDAIVKAVEEKDVEVNIKKVSGFKEVGRAIDQMRSDITNSLGNIERIRGKDGHTPTNKELVALIKPLIPEPIEGQPGADGQDAVVDYEFVIREVLKDIELPEVDREEVLNDLIEQLPQIGEAIRDSLELLPKGERLYVDAIESKKGRGLDEIIQDLYNRIANKAQRVGGTVRMWVTEEDGNPDVQTNRIKFPNGTVTQNADGTVSVDNAGITVATSDLSSQCDGATKVFTVPTHTGYIGLLGTDFPIVYRPVIDFDTSGTTLTLTSEVPSPSSGATLIFQYYV